MEGWKVLCHSYDILLPGVAWLVVSSARLPLFWHLLPEEHTLARYAT